MSSVAYTDVAIGLLVTAGCIIALPAMLLRVGGWTAMHAALPPSHFTFRGGMGWSELLGYFFPTFTLMVGNQSSYQKFFSARSERDARLSVVGWIVGTLFLETIIVLLAMVGGVQFRKEIESGALPAWGIVPYTARHGVAPLVGAIFLGAVFAKVLSTGNNYLFSPATNVVHDVFQRLFSQDCGRSHLAAFFTDHRGGPWGHRTGAKLPALGSGHGSLCLRRIWRGANACHRGRFLLEAYNHRRGA